VSQQECLCKEADTDCLNSRRDPADLFQRIPQGELGVGFRGVSQELVYATLLD